MSEGNTESASSSSSTLLSVKAAKRHSTSKPFGLREKFAHILEEHKINTGEDIEIARKLLNKDKVWSNSHVFITCLIQLLEHAEDNKESQSSDLRSSRQLFSLLVSPMCYKFFVEIGAKSLLSERDAQLLARTSHLLWKLWNFMKTMDDISAQMVKFIVNSQISCDRGASSTSASGSQRNSGDSPLKDMLYGSSSLVARERSFGEMTPIPAFIYQTLFRILVQDDHIVSSNNSEESKQEDVIVVMRTEIRAAGIIPCILQLISRANIDVTEQCLSIFSGILENPDSLRLYATSDNWQLYVLQILKHVMELIGPNLKQISIESVGMNGVKFLVDLKDDNKSSDEANLYTKLLYLLINSYVKGLYFIFMNSTEDDIIFKLLTFPINFFRQYLGWTNSSAWITRMLLYSLCSKLQNNKSALLAQSLSGSAWKNFEYLCKSVEYFILYCPIAPLDVKLDDVTVLFGIHIRKGVSEDLIVLNRLLSMISDHKRENFDPSLYPNLSKVDRQVMNDVWELLQREKMYFQRLSYLLQRIYSKENFEDIIQQIDSRQVHFRSNPKILEPKDMSAALTYCRRKACVELGKMSCYRAVVQLGKNGKFVKDSQKKVLIDIEEYSEEDHKVPSQIVSSSNALLVLPVPNPEHRRVSSIETRGKKKSVLPLQQDISKSQTIKLLKPESASPFSSQAKGKHINFKECRCLCLVFRDSSSTLSAQFPFEEIDLFQVEMMYIPRFPSSVESRLRSISSLPSSLLSDTEEESFEKEQHELQYQLNQENSVLKEAFKIVFQVFQSESLGNLYFITEEERGKFVRKCKSINPGIGLVYGPKEFMDPAKIEPKEVSQCEVGCGTNFSMLNRRVVCYRCKRTCCKNCANQKVPLPEFDFHNDGSVKFRVCGDCIRVRTSDIVE